MSRLLMNGWFFSFGLMSAAMAYAGEVPVSRDGYILQAEQQGQGSVVVVFESGFGQGADVWKEVILNLGAECQCISYARAGVGKSGTDGKPKTIEEHLQDLAAVVDTVVPDQKVVLVGHSYGGLLATEFARANPGRLKGLVLIDPATMGQRHSFRRANLDRVLADDKALLSMLPPSMSEDYKLLTAQLDSKDAASVRSMPDLEVALLTSTQVSAEPFVFEESAPGKELWKQQHAELFAAFSHGIHQYYATGHNIHRENPKAVADAIRFVAAASRAAK